MATLVLSLYYSPALNNKQTDIINEKVKEINCQLHLCMMLECHDLLNNPSET